MCQISLLSLLGISIVLLTRAECLVWCERLLQAPNREIRRRGGAPLRTNIPGELGFFDQRVHAVHIGSLRHPHDYDPTPSWRTTESEYAQSLGLS